MNCRILYLWAALSPDSLGQRWVSRLTPLLPMCMLGPDPCVTGQAAEEATLIPVLLEKHVHNCHSPTTRTSYVSCERSSPQPPTPPPPPCCCCSYSIYCARKQRLFLSISIPLARPKEESPRGRWKSYPGMSLLHSSTLDSRCRGQSRMLGTGFWDQQDRPGAGALGALV